MDRDEAVARYLELRPVIRARVEASVPPELREQGASLTAHQLSALSALPADGLTMRQLAVAMGVMAATASVLADRLVAQGLATRSHDPRDRRVVRLRPTAEGRALAERAAESSHRAAESLFARLSDAQVAAWLDVLETLAADDDPAAEPTTPLLEGAR